MRNLERYYENEAGDQRPWNRTAWNNAEPKFVDNPYWELNKNTNNDKRHRFFGNIGFTYEFSSQLYWVGKIYGDIYSLTKEDRKAVGSFGTPYYTKTVYNNSDFNYETRLHYTPKLSKNFTLTGFIGLSRRNGKYGRSCLS